MFRKAVFSAKNEVMDTQPPISMRSLVQKGGVPADQALRIIRTVLSRSAGELAQSADRISPDHFSLEGTRLPHLSPAGSIYLAPELRVDGLESGERAAVYSIGATLYELLTGEAPDERPFAPDVISAVRDAVVANGAAGFGVNDLAVTLSHLLNPDPFERYESLYDVDRVLEQVHSFSAAKPEPSGGADRSLAAVSELIRGVDIAPTSQVEHSTSAQGVSVDDSIMLPRQARDKPPDSKRGIKWNTPDFDQSQKDQKAKTTNQERSRTSSRARKDSSDRIELKLRTPQRSLLERVGWKGVRLQGDKAEREENRSQIQPKLTRNRQLGNESLDLDTSIRKRPTSRLGDRFTSGVGLLSDSAGAEESAPLVWDVLIVNFFLTLSISFFIAVLLLQCLEVLPVSQIMISGLSQESLIMSDRAALMVVIVSMLGLPVLVLMAAASSAWRALFAWSQQVVVMLLLYALLFQVNLSRLAAAASLRELDPLAHMDAARAALVNLIEAAGLAPRITPLTASGRFAVPVFIEQTQFSIVHEIFGIALISFVLLSTVLIIAKQQRFNVWQSLRTFLSLFGLVVFEMIITFTVVFFNVPILSEPFSLFPKGLGVEPPLCVLGFASANLIFGWVVIARHARLRLRADSASWLSALRPGRSVSRDNEL